jgi:hypothetical protein
MTRVSHNVEMTAKPANAAPQMAALRRESFHDRIAEKLAADPDWK